MYTLKIWGKIGLLFVCALAFLLILPNPARSSAEKTADISRGHPNNSDGLEFPDSESLFTLASLTENIQSSIYGPHRNDPAQGVPSHAYSPFDEENSQEYSCPPGGCDYAPGTLLVKIAPEISVNKTGERDGLSGASLTSNIELDRALAAQGVTGLDPLFPTAKAPTRGEMVLGPRGETFPKPDLSRWYRITFAKSTDIVEAIRVFRTTAGVEWVEPDYLRKPIGNYSTSQSLGLMTSLHDGHPISYSKALNSLPGPGTDPLYSQQWHLDAASIPQAWAYLQGQGLPPGGNHDIVVAVIDTGVDYTHPDLAVNMWVNPAEMGGVTGYDDDHNGYIDDIYGANTVTPSSTPMDDLGHGTHVAGIIAAQASNGIGGVGVAYNVQVMALKAAQSNGALSASDIAEAVYYAVEKGADVINMSFGSYARSQVEEDALAVAFGQAVLVAAAGNNGIMNLPCGQDMYPAAYNWVLGVMAQTQYPDSDGDYLASFSNLECQYDDTHEYELMAPGMDVWSTLPGGNYAAWDGTSMSAPIVSGIAALLRTYWSDPDAYSSRFLMGQIAKTTNSLQAYTPCFLCAPVYFPSTDALAGLTNFPQPSLTYLENWHFDTTNIDPVNDDDGIVDSGETIDLAVSIKNHWGKADPVTVTLEASSPVDGSLDSYVTWITDTVSYGAVGSFNQDDNGFIYDSGGAIISVRYPFRFSIPSSTPNGHRIDILVTITAGNGLNPGDPNAPYVSQSRFYLMVQRGRDVPSVIAQDMILNKDDYWILNQDTLIEPGVTVTITEGTQVQFGSSSCKHIRVRGSLNVQGTFEEPVELFAGSSGCTAYIYAEGLSRTIMQYTKILDGWLRADQVDEGLGNLIDHVYSYGNYFYVSGNVTNTKISVVRFSGPTFGGYGYYDTCLFDKLKEYSDLYFRPRRVLNSVFLQDNSIDAGVGIGPFYTKSASINWNAFMNKFWDPNPDHWMRIYANGGDSNTLFNFSNNFLNTTSTTLIDQMLYDYYDSWSLGKIVYQPFLTVPVTTTYPFVYDVAISTESLARTTVVGPEVITFTISYNRDMDTTIQPAVSFGQSYPYTDYKLDPVYEGWRDARTWVGSKRITPTTGDGYHFMRISGGRAADDPWLVIGDDIKRYRFEVVTSGSTAMNLQATGGEGYIDLIWAQDDFDLLAGFNLYKATSSSGPFTRINSLLIPPGQHSWRDTNVIPGKPYYYKFTVVKSDMSESGFSNIASASPVDTIPPVIQHTPVTTAPYGLPLSLVANVTDNVAVQQVILFFRHMGDALYQELPMTQTTPGRYVATIEGTRMTSPGVEYYIVAKDEVGQANSGRPENPYQVSVIDRPFLATVIPDHGPSSGNIPVTLSGSNFKPGSSVTFGGAPASVVTVLSSNQITCTAPAHFPAIVDVTVHNPDGQTSTLLRSFTYVSEVASVSLPEAIGRQYTTILIPVLIDNAQGLGAADFRVEFDQNVIHALGATPGNLTAGWNLATNATVPGQITVSMAGTGVLVTGSGVLANLHFDIVGTPGMTTTLHLAQLSLNDGAIPTDIADGSFTVDIVYDISGVIQFWNGGVVSNTLMTLLGTRSYYAKSNSSGNFLISGARVDDYVLTPEKSDEAYQITAYDASLALQHAATGSSLSGYALTAADVNRSGSVTSMDAFYILQKAVDLLTLPFPGAGVIWSFDPSSRSYTQLSSHQVNQNFIAVLLGDPSGNWNSYTALFQQDEFYQQNMADIGVVCSRPDASGGVTVTLEIDSITDPVFSFDLAIQYDPLQAQLTNTTVSEITNNWMLASNLPNAGDLRIGMASAEPAISSGTILNLYFQLINYPLPSLVYIRNGLINENQILGGYTGCNIGEYKIYLPMMKR